MAKLALLFLAVLCVTQRLTLELTVEIISWAGRLSQEVEEEITPSRIKEIREKVEKSVKSLHDKIESAEVSEKLKQHLENAGEKVMEIAKDLRLKNNKPSEEATTAN